MLGQEKVSEKSNEITAIPKLLNLLEISGAIISLDAMGCQKEIAQLIRQQGGDYLLILKGNQGSLYEDVELFLETEVKKDDSNYIDCFEEIDKGHGRIETRRCRAGINKQT